MVAELRSPDLALAPRLTPYVPHYPFPKQAAFLLLPDNEALYGGAAGPGKSDALLMAALQYVDVPGYAALLLRRTFADLDKPGALMDRAREWLSSSNARWIERNKTWHFPSGASLSFGFMETDKDRYNYQGAEYQFIGFDELTQFTEVQYRYLFSRLRRPSKLNPLSLLAHVPLRMRAASNPGGVGHQWVARRFDINNTGHGAVFIKARLRDNPYVDYEEYVKQLQELDPITRAQLLDGDWSARVSGTYFHREDFIEISPEDWPSHLAQIRFWDLAATEAKPGRDPDWTAGTLAAQDPETGVIYIWPNRHMRGRPSQVEDMLRATASTDNELSSDGHVEIYFEQEPGASGKALVDNYKRHLLAGYTVNVLVAGSRGSKVALAGPLSSQVDAHNVRIVKGPYLSAFYDELESFPDGEHDDYVDSVASAYFILKGDAWKVKARQRRSSHGLSNYLTSRTTVCINEGCKQPVWWPATYTEVRCGYCDYLNTRLTLTEEAAHA